MIITHEKLIAFIAAMPRDQLETLARNVVGSLYGTTTDDDATALEYDQANEWHAGTIEDVAEDLDSVGLTPDFIEAQSQGRALANTPTRDDKSAALLLAETIEATGGVTERTCDQDGGPAGDPEWLDLGDAYRKACKELGRAPVVVPADLE